MKVGISTSEVVKVSWIAVEVGTVLMDADENSTNNSKKMNK